MLLSEHTKWSSFLYLDRKTINLFKMIVICKDSVILLISSFEDVKSEYIRVKSVYQLSALKWDTFLLFLLGNVNHKPTAFNVKLHLYWTDVLGHKLKTL